MVITFLETAELLFKAATPFYSPTHNQYVRIPFSPHPQPIFVIVLFFFFFFFLSGLKQQSFISSQFCR